MLPYQFQVQQSLATPGTLERFVKDTNKVAEIREVFTGLYALDLVNADDIFVLQQLFSNI